MRRFPNLRMLASIIASLYAPLTPKSVESPTAWGDTMTSYRLMTPPPAVKGRMWG
jgi:hypothetical protein